MTYLLDTSVWLTSRFSGPPRACSTKCVVAGSASLRSNTPFIVLLFDQAIDPARRPPYDMLVQEHPT